MNRFLLTVYLLLLGASLFAQVPKNELQALTDLYHSTNGKEWNQSWDLKKDVSFWEGVTIENDHVTEIRMLFNNLNGTLPASLSQLEQLKVLELSFNKISGSLPSQIGALKNLEVLALNGNHLSGTIPASFGNLKALKQLHLSSNELSGTVPQSFNQLDQLVVFNVFQNQLRGEVPIGLARGRNIKEFIIAENNFNPTTGLSTILISNSAQINFSESDIYTTGKQIIAIETENED